MSEDLNPVFNEHFEIKTDVPNVGETVYVPSIPAADRNGGWDSFEKIGGWAVVNQVQKGPDGSHYVAVMEFGGYQMCWESYLRDQQEQLAKHIGLGYHAFLKP